MNGYVTAGLNTADDGRVDQREGRLPARISAWRRELHYARVTILGCAIRIRGHSASGTNTNTNAMSKDECANGEVAVTLFFKICRHFFKLIFKKKIIP